MLEISHAMMAQWISKYASQNQWNQSVNLAITYRNFICLILHKQQWPVECKWKKYHQKTINLQNISCSPFILIITISFLPLRPWPQRRVMTLAWKAATALMARPLMMRVNASLHHSALVYLMAKSFSQDLRPCLNLRFGWFS